MPLESDKLENGFVLGPWTVLPLRNLISKGQSSAHIEPMVMEVLLTLVRNQGQVVSKDKLIEAVWGGRMTSDDAIAAKIGALRKRLGDSSKNPVFIETVQKRGYRLKASVVVRGLQPTDETVPTPSTRSKWLSGAVAIGMLLGLFWMLKPGAQDIDAIAVLPFKNLSDDKARHQYIVDGFGEEIVVSLGRVPGVRVTRGSESKEESSLKERARELNVNAVVSGSVRVDGERLRITVIATSEDGFQLSSDTFDGQISSIFDIQESVANGVALMLFNATDEQTLVASRPANFDAFDDYMLGQFFLAKRDLESLQQADDLFASTIEKDPAFGPAYLRRGITQLLVADYFPDQKHDLYDSALAVARLGGQRDTEIRQAIQLIHGFVHHQRGNWAEASDAFEAAFNGPTVYSPSVYHWHSRYLGDLGFLQQSLDQAAQARAMEPASQVLNSRLAIAYLWADDMENAAHYFDVANKMGIGVPDHYLGYSVYLMRSGRIDEARDAVRTAFRLAQKGVDWLDPVFDSLADPQDQGHRAAALQALRIASDDGVVPPYVSMTIYTLIGETDLAIEIALQEAAANGAIYELEIVFIDEFREFRRHPEFLNLMESLGVTRQWTRMGCSWADGQIHC